MRVTTLGELWVTTLTNALKKREEKKRETEKKTTLLGKSEIIKFVYEYKILIYIREADS